MRRIRGIAAGILLAASFVARAGVCEAREVAAKHVESGTMAARSLAAAGQWSAVLRAIAFARHIVWNACVEEAPSSALPITSWGQIKDKYRDPVGPIKN